MTENAVSKKLNVIDIQMSHESERKFKDSTRYIRVYQHNIDCITKDWLVYFYFVMYKSS